jgi:translation initiation factor 2 subunit 3
MINICTLGSVADGKSTMVKMLTGEKTQRDSRELIRNITINAGYSNLKIWNCIECNKKYSSGEIIKEYDCNNCNNKCVLIKHISFIDCPGHQELMSTMLSSVSIANFCIIIISVEKPLNEKPQLKQHLLAAKFANFKNIIICLNKCDLQTKTVVMYRYNELINLLNEYNIKYSIIIPTSFTNNCGINELIESIDKFTSIPIQNELKTIFRITRTFDVNKPGTPYNLVKGGCIGGTLISGKLNINDEVEIRPGIINLKNKTHVPIITKIISCQTNNCDIDEINVGGLVSINTVIDPYYCKNNKMLCGHILGKVGELPQVYTTIKINFTQIDTIWQPKNGDQIYLQIQNMSVEGRLTKFKNNIFTFDLLKPACIDEKLEILVCRKQPNITIVGYGLMV